MNLSTAAAAIIAIASQAPSHLRFGDRKVFLCALNLTPALRATILACSKAGLLTLARADLVCMMDADTVAASLLETDGATYHFVCVPPFASAPTAAAPAAAALTRAQLLAARGCRPIGTHR